MNRAGGHAVVLGAGMAGLLTARVLSDFYDRVTVVERDVLPEHGDERRGTPQCRHTHLLLPSGAEVIGELFPGIAGELAASGVPIADADLAGIHFSVLGHRLTQQGRMEAGQELYFASRPNLEGHVRRRVRGLPAVTVLDGHDVAGLTATPEGDRVTGVRVQPRDGGEGVALSADLVVDALGRGSRTPVWLEDLGYPRPAENRVNVGVSYATRPLRIPAGTLREKVFLIGPAPGRPASMGLIGYEDDRWLLTVVAGAGNEPPLDPADMIAFAGRLLPPHAFEAINDARPDGDVVKHRYPYSRWRRYDRQRALPGGLLVTGDAFCGFNPIYGQGMAVAALEAMALRRCLRDGGGHDLHRRFFRAAAKPAGVAWRLATGTDLALPEIEGRRTPAVRLSNAYVDRVLTAAESDPVVAEQFLRVSGLLDAPGRLMRPGILRRVLASGRGRPVHGPAGSGRGEVVTLSNR